jgi:hypothetical protein
MTVCSQTLHVISTLEQFEQASETEAVRPEPMIKVPTNRRGNAHP